MATNFNAEQLRKYIETIAKQILQNSQEFESFFTGYVLDVKNGVYTIQLSTEVEAPIEAISIDKKTYKADDFVYVIKANNGLTTNYLILELVHDLQETFVNLTLAERFEETGKLFTEGFDLESGSRQILETGTGEDKIAISSIRESGAFKIQAKFSNIDDNAIQGGLEIALMKVDPELNINEVLKKYFLVADDLIGQIENMDNLLQEKVFFVEEGYRDEINCIRISKVGKAGTFSVWDINLIAGILLDVDAVMQVTVDINNEKDFFSKDEIENHDDTVKLFASVYYDGEKLTQGTPVQYYWLIKASHDIDFNINKTVIYVRTVTDDDESNVVISQNTTETLSSFGYDAAKQQYYLRCGKDTYYYLGSGDSEIGILSEKWGGQEVGGKTYYLYTEPVFEKIKKIPVSSDTISEQNQREISLEKGWFCLNDYELVDYIDCAEGAPITSKLKVWDNTSNFIELTYVDSVDHPEINIVKNLFCDYANTVKCLVRYGDNIVSSDSLTIYNYKHESFDARIICEQPAEILFENSNFALTCEVVNDNKRIQIKDYKYTYKWYRYNNTAEAWEAVQTEAGAAVEGEAAKTIYIYDREKAHQSGNNNFDSTVYFVKMRPDELGQERFKCEVQVNSSDNNKISTEVAEVTVRSQVALGNEIIAETAYYYYLSKNTDVRFIEVPLKEGEQISATAPNWRIDDNSVAKNWKNGKSAYNIYENLDIKTNPLFSPYEKNEIELNGMYIYVTQQTSWYAVPKADASKKSLVKSEAWTFPVIARQVAWINNELANFKLGYSIDQLNTFNQLTNGGKDQGIFYSDMAAKKVDLTVVTIPDPDTKYYKKTTDDKGKSVFTLITLAIKWAYRDDKDYFVSNGSGGYTPVKRAGVTEAEENSHNNDTIYYSEETQIGDDGNSITVYKPLSRITANFKTQEVTWPDNIKNDDNPEVYTDIDKKLFINADYIQTGTLRVGDAGKERFYASLHDETVKIGGFYVDDTHLENTSVLLDEEDTEILEPVTTVNEKGEIVPVLNEYGQPVYQKKRRRVSLGQDGLVVGEGFSAVYGTDGKVHVTIAGDVTFSGVGAGKDTTLEGIKDNVLAEALNKQVCVLYHAAITDAEGNKAIPNVPSANTPYEEYKDDASETEAWHKIKSNDDIWQSQKVDFEGGTAAWGSVFQIEGLDGPRGPIGPKGDSWQSIYKWSSTILEDAPYVSYPPEDDTGNVGWMSHSWETNLTDDENALLYMSQRLFKADMLDPRGEWSAPVCISGADGTSKYELAITDDFISVPVNQSGDAYYDGTDFVITSVNQKLDVYPTIGLYHGDERQRIEIDHCYMRMSGIERAELYDGSPDPFVLTVLGIHFTSPEVSRGSIKISYHNRPVEGLSSDELYDSQMAEAMIEVVKQYAGEDGEYIYALADTEVFKIDGTGSLYPADGTNVYLYKKTGSSEPEKLTDSFYWEIANGSIYNKTSNSFADSDMIAPSVTIKPELNGEPCVLTVYKDDGPDPVVLDKITFNTVKDGEHGKDGSDAIYIYYLSQESKTWTTDDIPEDADVEKTQPSSLKDGVWTPSPQGVTPIYQYEYMSVKKKAAGTEKNPNPEWTNIPYSLPTLWSKYGEKGFDGDGVEYLFRAFADKQDSFDPINKNNESNWDDDPPALTAEMPFIYVVVKKVAVDKSTGDITITYSTPTLWDQLRKEKFCVYKYSIDLPTDEPDSDAYENKETESNGWYTYIPDSEISGAGLWVREKYDYAITGEISWSAPYLYGLDPNLDYSSLLKEMSTTYVYAQSTEPDVCPPDNIGWLEEEAFFSIWTGVTNELDKVTYPWIRSMTAFQGGISTLGQKVARVPELDAVKLAAKYQIKNDRYVVDFQGANGTFPVIASEDEEAYRFIDITAALTEEDLDSREHIDSNNSAFSTDLPNGLSKTMVDGTPAIQSEVNGNIEYYIYNGYNESTNLDSWVREGSGSEKTYLYTVPLVEKADGDAITASTICGIDFQTVVPEGDLGRWCRLYNKAVTSGGAIVAGSITADKLKVNALSAISADLGEITSGEIQSPGYVNVIAPTSLDYFDFTEINNNSEVSISIKSEGLDRSIITGTLQIPAVYEGRAVTEITSLQDCSNVTKIIIPKSVRKITPEALRGCGKLEELITPFVGYEYNVRAGALGTMFGEDFYQGSIMVKQYHHKAPGDDADTYAYYLPSTLTKIIFTGDYIQYGAFHSCTQLRNIQVTYGLKTIDTAAFALCQGLQKFSIPNSVTLIGYRAFYNCTELKEIIIPTSVTTMGERVFENCYNLKIYCEFESLPSNEWATNWNSHSDTYSIVPTYWYNSDWVYGDTGFKISCSDTNMINSKYFKVTQDGAITATSGTIGGFHITADHLASGDSNVDGSLADHDVYLSPGSDPRDFVFWAGPRAHGSTDDSTRPFWVKRDGTMQAGKGTFIATMLEIKPSDQQYNAYIKFDANVKDAKLYIDDTANSITLSPTKLEFHGENVKDGSGNEFKGFISINPTDGLIVGTEYNDGRLYDSYPIGKLQGNWEVHRACTTAYRGAITNIRSITIPLLALYGNDSYWVNKVAVGDDNYCQLVTKKTAQTKGSIITALIYLFPKDDITMVGYLSGTSLYMEPLTATDSPDRNKYVVGNRFSYIDGGSCTPIAGVNDLLSDLGAIRTINNNFAILETDDEIQGFLDSITSRITRLWVKYPPGNVVKAGGENEPTIRYIFEGYFSFNAAHLPIAIWTCGTFTSSGGNLYFLEKGNLINLFGSN